MGNVPVVRRQLTAHPARTLASGAAVGLAVMLVLLLDGLWTGVLDQAAAFERHSGAELFVVAPDTTSLFAEAGRVDPATLDAVRATPGVGDASPATTAYAIVDLHDRKVAVSLVGTPDGGLGSAWSMADGRAPAADGELAVDRTLAARHDIHLGDSLSVLGGELRVVGLTRDTAAFMTPYVFTTQATAARLVGRPDTYTAILVATGADADADAVRAALEAQGLGVTTRDELAESARATARRVYGTPLRLMVGVAVATGVLLAALTGYAAVAERQRDWAVLKAIGARGRRLTAAALATTLFVALIGVAFGAVWFAMMRAGLGWWRPQFGIAVTVGGAGRAVAAAVVMAAAGGLVPAWRLAQLSPAQAFSGSGS